MAIIGLVVSIVGLGAVCWLLFSLAVYALPFCVGMTIAFPALQRGSGIMVAFAVGAFAAGITLALGRIAFAAARPPLVRALIGLLYALPAALAGYHLSLALAKIGMTDEGWLEACAFVGAGLIGVTAFARMALVAPPVVGQGVEASPYTSFFLRQREKTRVQLLPSDLRTGWRRWAP